MAVEAHDGATSTLASVAVSVTPMIGLSVDRYAVASSNAMDHAAFTIGGARDTSQALEVSYEVIWASAAQTDVHEGLEPLGEGVVQTVTLDVGQTHHTITVTAVNDTDTNIETLRVRLVDQEEYDLLPPYDPTKPETSRAMNALEDATGWHWFAQEGTMEIIPAVALFGKYRDSTHTSADDTAIHQNDVRQGAVPNCWCMAAAYSLAMRRPDAIANMLTDNNDGTYTATFRVPDSMLTQDVHIGGNIFGHAASAHLSGDYDSDGRIEVWTLVFEQAVAAAGITHIGTLWQETTGDASGQHYVTKTTPNIVQLIEDAIEDEKMVVVSTYDPDDPEAEAVRDAAMYPQHAYAATELIQDDDGDSALRVRNPWGFRDAVVKLTDIRGLFRAVDIL